MTCILYATLVNNANACSLLEYTSTVTLSQLFKSLTLDIHLYFQLLSAQNHVESCQLEQTFHLDLLFSTVASSYFLIFVIAQSLWCSMRLWIVPCFSSLVPSHKYGHGEKFLLYPL